MLLSSPNGTLEGLVILSFIVIPVIYLIKAKQKKTPGEDEVTDSYLDEIINSEDEEIDF